MLVSHDSVRGCGDYIRGCGDYIRGCGDYIRDYIRGCGEGYLYMYLADAGILF